MANERRIWRKILILNKRKVKKKNRCNGGQIERRKDGKRDEIRETKGGNGERKVSWVNGSSKRKRDWSEKIKKWTEEEGEKTEWKGRKERVELKMMREGEEKETNTRKDIRHQTKEEAERTEWMERRKKRNWSERKRNEKDSKGTISININDISIIKENGRQNNERNIRALQTTQTVFFSPAKQTRETQRDKTRPTKH